MTRGVAETGDRHAAVGSHQVAPGLSFLFASLSLIASGAHEMMAALLALRAKALEKGVANRWPIRGRRSRSTRTP